MTDEPDNPQGGQFKPRPENTGDWMLNALNARSNAQDRSRPGLVYFVSFGEGGPIKIGFSSNFEHRLQGLQTGCPYELIVLAKVPAGMGLERDLQRRFAKHKLRAEWFSPHPDILAEIDRLTTPAATIVEEV